jgi:hypothetical protein
VGKVVEGDTIRGKVNKRVEKIRLFDVDGPERHPNPWQRRTQSGPEMVRRQCLLNYYEIKRILLPSSRQYHDFAEEEDPWIEDRGEVAKAVLEEVH